MALLALPSLVVERTTAAPAITLVFRTEGEGRGALAASIILIREAKVFPKVPLPPHQLQESLERVSIKLSQVLSGGR